MPLSLHCGGKRWWIKGCGARGVGRTLGGGGPGQGRRRREGEGREREAGGGAAARG